MRRGDRVGVLLANSVAFMFAIAILADSGADVLIAHVPDQFRSSCQEK